MADPRSRKHRKQAAPGAGFRRATLSVAAVSVAASIALVASSCGKGIPSSEPEETSYQPPETTTTVSTTPVTTEAPLTLLPEAEAELEKNPHAAGWINIPGIVDEPITHLTDEETGNEFYVDHGYDQKPHPAGTIFADYRNVLDGSNQSDNIILYGHSQKDNSRFGPLQRQFRWNPGLVKSKPVINFRTNYEERVYKVYALFLTNVEEEDDNGVLFDYHNYIKWDEDRYNDWIENVDKRNMVHTGVDVEYGDKFITLSTCAYDFEPSRLVMIGRLVREGESEEVDTTKFYVVDNPYMPARVYGGKNYK